MNIEIKHQLEHGFSIEGVATKAVFSSEDACETVRRFHHLDALGEDRNTFHFYSAKFLENVEETRRLYLELGHKVKLFSKIPACVLKYNTLTRKDVQVYRIHNGIYYKGQSTFDITTPYKLRDLMEMEVKTIFNTSYRLDLTDIDKPKMIRVERPETAKIEEVVETIMNVGHTAFIKQAIDNLVQVERGKIYQGRFFSIVFQQPADNTFRFNLNGNKPGSDSVTFECTGGNFKVTLIQPVQKVQMDVTRQLLFEIISSIYREVSYSQGPLSLRNKRKQRA